MPLTRRAKRRLILLFGLGVIAVVGSLGLWNIQKMIKDGRAAQARKDGMAAAANGNWQEALPDLSLAVARKKNDLDALLMLAETRSQIPAVSGRHIRSALNLFSKAANLARVSDSDQQSLQTALLGKARMEVAIGNIKILQRTSLEILELDPENDQALSYLYEIQKVRGSFLPRRWELFARGPWESDAAWLQAIRNDETDSEDPPALRWALERMILDETEMRRREDVLRVIRAGGSSDVQRLQLVPIADREETIDVARIWAESGPDDDAMLHLVLAGEALRSDDPEAARKAIEIVEDRLGNQADFILQAAEVRTSLGGRENLDKAEALIKRAQGLAAEDTEAATMLAARAWHQGRTTDMRLMLALDSTGDSKVLLDYSLLGAIIKTLDRDEEAAEAVEELRVQSDGIGDANQQGISVNLVIGLLDILNELVAGQDRSREEILAQVMAAAARFPDQSLIQTLVGDIFSELGQSGPATDAWARGLEIERHKSAPIANRLINGLLADGSIHRAFEEAVEVAGRTQTIQGAVLLCRAWMALESAGIPPQSVVPSFSLADSALKFIETLIAAVEEGEGDAMFLQPLLAQAAVRSGEMDLANRIISEALANEADISILLPLSQASLRGGLDREAELLKMIRDLDVDNDFEDELLILQSSMLRKKGEAAEAFALSEAYFENRLDDRSRRLRQMEVLDGLAAGGVPAKQAMEILMASEAGELEDGVLFRLLTGMIEAQDRELAEEVLQRMALEFDDDSGISSSLALGLARFTLAFDRDVDESVTAAILRLDPIVSAGASTIEHELTMVELLGLQNPPKTTRAIEVLRDSVRRRPGRFDTTLRLISFLQKAGRFQEADEFLAEVWRRRESAPPQVRRLIPRLMSGQGDVDEIMASQCELAQETGNPVDRLACIRARYQAGEVEQADADLDLMMLMAERPVAVDMEAASRSVRRGDVDGAIEILQTAEGFESSLDRTRAVGSLLLRTKRLAELDALLLEMVEVTENSADLQILVCLRELAFDPPRYEEANLALIRAVELGRDRSEILQRVLTIRVENPELRDGADEAVALLSQMNPQEARLLDLALRVPISAGGFKPSVAQLEESKAILEIQADYRAAWLLAINLHLGVLEKALAGTWPDGDDLVTSTQRKLTPEALRQRLQIATVDLLVSATSRFPGDMLFPVQLSEVYLRLGRLDEALSSAREGLRRAGSGRKLGNAIPVAVVEARLGRPDLVLATLEPYQDDVNANPSSRPRAWRLLVESLLLEGRVEEAWTLFRGLVSTPDPTALSLVWLETASKASPRIASAAIEKAKEMIPPGMGRLRFAGAGLAAFGRTGDPGLRLLTEEILSEIMAGGPSAPNAMQVDLIGAGIISFSSNLDAIRSYQDILSRIPASIMEDLLVFPSLDERRKSIAGPYFNAAVMAMNNMAAITATLAMEGTLPLDEAAEWLDRASEASTRLVTMVPNSPEVVDTRAMVAIATGDTADAVGFAREAVVAVPDRAAFRWTLARALNADGQSAAAIEAAREASQILRRSEEKDEDLALELSNFLGRN